jgi:hypothetical protein
LVSVPGTFYTRYNPRVHHQSAKLGSTADFRWFAYTDAGLIAGTDGTVSNAGDRIGDQFEPGGSSNCEISMIA